MKIDFEKFNSMQNANFKDAMEAYKNKTAASSDRPPVLYVELTRNCIARCAFCRGSKWVNDLSYNMKRETFELLLRDYIPYAILVDLRAQGESLMLENFDEYVKKVDAVGPKIRLTTTLGCGSRKALQSLIDHDVFVSVSFDAADKKAYEKIRPGVNYDTVISNLEFIVNGMKKKYGTVKDKVRLGISPLQKENLCYAEGILKLAEHYGISDVLILPLSSGSDSIDALNNNKYSTVKTMEKCIDRSKRSGISLTMCSSLFDDFKIESKSIDLCCHPWLYAQINYKGDISFCDHLVGDSHPDCILGNINDDKDKGWNGKKSQENRKAHASGCMNAIYKYCRACYEGGRYSDHEHELSNLFSKWHVNEKGIKLIIDNVKIKKNKYLRDDILFHAKRFGKRNLPKLHKVYRKIKSLMQKAEHMHE